MKWFLVLFLILLTSSLASAENVNSTNLTVWYKFDENAGTVLVDSSGHQYNSSSTTNLTWTTGQYKTAGSFNGASSLVTIPASSLSTNNTMTIISVFNTSTVSKDEQTIISQLGGLALRNYQLLLNYDKPRLVVGNGTSSYTKTFNILIIPNKTYFIAVTMSGTNEKLYLWNGTGWYTETGTSTIPLKANNTQDFKIGGVSPTYSTTMWTGWIDNLMIWNRVLTDSEIQTIGNNSMYFSRSSDFMNYTTPLIATYAPITIVNPYDYVKIFLFGIIAFCEMLVLMDGLKNQIIK